MRQKLIDEVLAAPVTGGDAGPRDGAIGAWERLLSHLSPLVGEAALCALYARALHVSFPEMPPSPASRDMRSTTVLLALLATQLAAMEPEAAVAFNRALLQSFTRLLSGLIGEALTARLMNTAWAERSGGKST